MQGFYLLRFLDEPPILALRLSMRPPKPASVVESLRRHRAEGDSSSGETSTAWSAISLKPLSTGISWDYFLVVVGGGSARGNPLPVCHDAGSRQGRQSRKANRCPWLACPSTKLLLRRHLQEARRLEGRPRSSGTSRVSIIS